MRVYSASKARDNFSQVVNEAAFGSVRIVIKKQGKNLVAIVPFSDFELLEFLETRIDIEEAKKALNEAKIQGGITLTDLKADLGMD